MENRLRWRFETEHNTFRSSPTVVDGTVYIGSDGAGYLENSNGLVHALAASDGTEQWRFQTQAGVLASPTVVEWTVFVGDGDGTVYALDANGGTEQWQFQTHDTVRSSPTVADGTVFVGSDDGKLYALHAETGEEQWQAHIIFDGWSSPVVVDDTVFVGTDNESRYSSHVYALDAETGERRWVFDSRRSIRSSPTVVDDTVIFSVTNGTLSALSIDTGEERWISNIGFNCRSSPTVANGVVFVGSHDEHVYAVSADDGTERWRFETDDSVLSSPTVADGVVFVGSRDEHVYAVSADDGTEQWRFETNHSVWSSPTVVDGTVFVGSDSVYALEADIEGTSEGSRVRLGALGHHDRTGHGDEPQHREEQRSHPGKNRERLQQTTETAAPLRIPHSAPPETVPEPPQIDLTVEEISIGDQIGTGGNADVFHGSAEALEETVDLAIKRPRFPRGQTVDPRPLLEEANTWQRLDDHDHIVTVVDYGTNDGLPWIAMEYMDGGHLGERAGTMEIQQALWTAISITNGVYHAHQLGVVHCDLSPENILFCEIDDAWDAPKIADWGLAKRLLEQSRSRDEMTVEYAAPEQFHSDESTGKHTDIYQLGAVLYELFTGRRPFEGDIYTVIDRIKNENPVPPSTVADIPTALDAPLLQALEKSRDDRYDDIIYLRDELETIASWN
ncbi:PQQ-binding-like beta-propeller repeat protein [Halomicrobium sp. LC1Hm]|uniref:outer membrane protein assembly factor BamB family protein n=1 Tax=Halomicrobium sp. LC1Hm TaxID=2610902 RepID=UPI0012982CE1|nr:PQQ-binding-like beta-propeller repeat protein [Halomicrobium sp. LC1Hm]QGA84424.1 PQQ repeat protein / protein kinase domain protein [Halomicrobium sp. LC1Hm]